MKSNHRTSPILRSHNLRTRVRQRENLHLRRLLEDERSQRSQRKERHVRKTESDEVGLFWEDIEVSWGERSGGDVEVAKFAGGEGGGFGEDGG